ncbi:MAG TPA: Mur ligase family protein, partial [Candidatus Dormibacteraeota bacterium]|nr:Mur ligase family protein [Candidatus Dormibacteraeota bacterium]
GAAQILGRSDVDVAVLETARGGLVLKGVGYESNDASVLTNVSSDHLDLQGIHTLPELAEVKATICRITRPSGRVVLNADDPLVRSVARRVRARVALFTLAPGSSGPVRRHLARGGVAYALRDGAIVELQGPDARPILEVADLPIAFSGMARHNVANALAAAAAARGLGTSLEAVAAGLRDFRPTSELSPGRLNVFRLGETLVIVDFAHNEAGVEAVLDVAAGLAAIGTGQAARITAIVGMAGDRPDEALRAVGRVAARRASRVAIKETLRYLRGRARESAVDELLSGMTEGGADRAAVPVYGSETEALAAELDLLERGSLGPGDGARTVMVLLCHEDREGVFALLHRRGAEPLEDLGEAAAAAPPGAAVPA